MRDGSNPTLLPAGKELEDPLAADEPSAEEDGDSSDEEDSNDEDVSREALEEDDDTALEVEVSVTTDELGTTVLPDGGAAEDDVDTLPDDDEPDEDEDDSVLAVVQPHARHSPDANHTGAQRCFMTSVWRAG